MFVSGRFVSRNTPRCCSKKSLRQVYKPHSVRRRGISCETVCAWMAIYLDATLPLRSSSLPGRSVSEETGRRAASLRRSDKTSCLTLLPAGVAWPLHYCRRRWSLTPPFHPCPCGRYVSVARSGRFPEKSGVSAPEVTRRRALRSADFPRSRRGDRGHPACLRHFHHT